MHSQQENLIVIFRDDASRLSVDSCSLIINRHLSVNVDRWTNENNTISVKWEKTSQLHDSIFLSFFKRIRRQVSCIARGKTRLPKVCESYAYCAARRGIKSGNSVGTHARCVFANNHRSRSLLAIRECAERVPVNVEILPLFAVLGKMSSMVCLSLFFSRWWNWQSEAWVRSKDGE